MTIDEAIRHCEEVMVENLEKTKDRNASDPIAINCFECADEHRQLAEWLKELKAYKEQSGDAISRQAAISAIEALQRPIMREESNYYQFKFSGMSEALNVVENLPSVTPQQKMERWIPVSERVPEDGEEVLCCLGSEEMAVLFRRNDWGQDEWVDGGFATGSYDVVAWMPLPLPFRAESEVDS